MQCSFTELKNLIFTAGLGSNIEVGTCDEISDAVATLELLGLNASKEALKCFQNKKRKKSNYKVYEKTLNFGHSTVLNEGISAVDFFRTNIYDEISFETIDSPLILCGLGLINDVECLRISTTKKIIGFIDERKNLYWNYQENSRPEFISIRKNNFNPPSYSSKLKRIKIEKSIWKELLFLSRKTLVPETEISRETGAGAGLNDND